MSIKKTVALTTEDDCEIRLHCYPAQGPSSLPPVLLVHGFAANAQMWTPPTQPDSLPSFLCRQGSNVYAIDLRFRSGQPKRDWDVDDYVLYDIPTALRYIEKDSGQDRIHWVGHSMGGLLAYMYQTLHGSDKILSTTVLGSPGFRAIRSHSQIMVLSTGLVAIAKTVTNTGRLDLLPPQIMATLVTMSFIAANPRKHKIKREHFAEFQTKSIVGNISYGEAKQLTSIVSKEGLKSTRHNFIYSNQARRIQSPLLAFSGNRDFIVRPRVVKQGYEESNSQFKKYINLGKKTNCKTAYGHLDLIMGPNAQSEIWPEILNWITEWSDPAQKPLTSPSPSPPKPFF